MSTTDDATTEILNVPYRKVVFVPNRFPGIIPFVKARGLSFVVNTGDEIIGAPKYITYATMIYSTDKPEKNTIGYGSNECEAASNAMLEWLHLYEDKEQ